MKVVDVILKKKHKKAPLGFSPYIEIGDISLSDKSYRIKNKGATNASILAEKGQLLISTVRPTRGAITMVREELVAASNAFVVLEVDNEKCLTNFLFYQLNSQKFFDFLGRRSKGATYPTCAKDDIYNYEIKLPALDEQERVVRLLENLAIILQRRRRQLQQLDTLVKAQFVEMFGSEYPRLVIGEKFKTTSGGTPSKKHAKYYSDGTIPWLTSGEVNAGIICNVKQKITEAAVKNSSAKLIPENSVLVAMYGATAGQVGLLKIPTTTNQAICSILPHKDYLPEFLYHAVASRKDWMIDQCVGGAQPNISQQIIRRMEIIDAPLDAQERFVKFVHQVDKSKFAIQKSLEKTQQLFDSLMQEYFG